MSDRSKAIRAVLAAVVLAAVLHVGARRVGPLPPLGNVLDPFSGAWSAAATAELADREALTIPQLDGPVEVLFDDRGVPHIFATTSDDAVRALGFVVARDRLFQMEMNWRSTAGRISELVGDAALGFDRRMRRLGLARSAERSYVQMDPNSPVVREAIAYAEGVNAFIDGLDRRGVPLEYRLLGAEPSRWEPIYTLYQLKLMGWNLTYFLGDLQRLRVAAIVGEEAADALLPVNSPIQQPIQPNGSRTPRFDFGPIPPPGRPNLAAAEWLSALELAVGPLPPGSESTVIGSNNWAVAPERTADGYALLSGDPHLGLTLPSIWYEAHLVVPGELDAYGVTFPSVPMIVIGMNRDVAWSFTNTGADVIDFYEEELDDTTRPTSYRVDGEWRPLEQKVEEIRGQGGRLLALDTLYFTHRGPLLMEEGRRVSMRWTVLENTPEVDALRLTNRAASVEDWLDGMQTFVAPAQNGIVADRAGTIAIRSTGHFPLHPDGRGFEIKDGRDSSNDWVGFWPVERYPFAIRPAQGYLASANQQPIDPGVDSTYLGFNWYSPWRAMRINALLAADSAVTPESMRRFQTDPGNARADFFVPYFLEAVVRAGNAGPVDERAKQAAGLLADWDRLYTKHNERAVLFEAAMANLAERTWDELLEDPDVDSNRRVFTPAGSVLAGLLQHPTNVWWDDRRTTDLVEDRDSILIASLAEALDEVVEEHGDPSEGGWRWDGIRHANIYHLMGLSSLSALDLRLQGGSGNLNPSSGRGTFGASWRMVVQLGPEIEAWSIYPGGQSGNPVSSRYLDRIEKWTKGELDPILFPRSTQEIEDSRAASVLELNPER
jgi:penicillin amidase